MDGVKVESYAMECAFKIFVLAIFEDSILKYDGGNSISEQS